MAKKTNQKKDPETDAFELCPYCDEEVLIHDGLTRINPVVECPNCKEIIKLCSTCPMACGHAEFSCADCCSIQNAHDIVQTDVADIPNHVAVLQEDGSTKFIFGATIIWANKFVEEGRVFLAPLRGESLDTNNESVFVPLEFSKVGAYCSLLQDYLNVVESGEGKDDCLKQFWEALGDVAIDPETELLEEPFMHFPKGTEREAVWSWFDNHYSKGVVALMFPRKKAQ